MYSWRTQTTGSSRRNDIGIQAHENAAVHAIRVPKLCRTPLDLSMSICKQAFPTFRFFDRGCVLYARGDLPETNSLMSRVGRKAGRWIIVKLHTCQLFEHWVMIHPKSGIDGCTWDG